MNLTKDTGSLDFLKQQVGMQREQAEVMLQIIERMDEQEKRVDDKVGHVEKLVEDVSKKVHIDEKEMYDIRSIVQRKAWEFAKIRLEFAGFGDLPNTDLILSKQGHFRMSLYKRLKNRFNVTKFTHIPHVKFEEACDYLESVEYDHLTYQELRWTPSQKRIIDKE